MEVDAASRGTALPEYLNEWVSKQRWYASKGRVPVLRSIGHWVLPAPEAGMSIRTYFVLDGLGSDAVLYQLPLTERSTPLPNGEQAFIVSTNRADGSAVFVYDAPHDPAYAQALLRFVLGNHSSPTGEDVTAHARGESLAEGEPARATVASSRVLSGEQSNTSIIFDVVDDDLHATRPIICKVFRVVHHGENPDVSVQSALARAGSRFVPEPIGCVVGEWEDPGQPGERATGHLAFAQEFLPGVEDAWRAALLAAEAGQDFREQARTLGEATAEVHVDLAEAMPTREATPEVIAAVVEGMRGRYRMAVAEVPALAGYESAIEFVFGRAQRSPWPRLQRIHGDYHLGQVLDVPGRGWVLLDFEGEPLRPLHERGQPDIPLRDVAGMLRSFSYVAGSVAIEHPEQDASTLTRWASACRDAFLDGYAARSGQDLSGRSALLDAFELDKALYETVYESRNRPAWLPIPLAAVLRLVAAIPSNVRD